jgi:ABC-2 type transport system permease protein
VNRLWAIARKELLHIVRDPRTLIVAILMPMMMVLLFGYAINMELEHVPVAILDEDQSSATRDFIRRMTASHFIVDAARITSRDAIESGFRRGSFRAAVIFPRGFAESLVSDPATPLQLLIDGADGTTAATVNNYLQAVVARVNAEIIHDRIGANRLPLQAQPRVFFNPELLSANFIVPGLVAVIMIMVGALLTSIAVTREKETGTLEQILTTPIAPHQLILGKVIPYMGIAALDATLVLAVGCLVFGVPMAGSWWVLSAYSVVYLVIALSLGLLVSTVSKTQQVAMAFALIVTMLPAIILSGFIFPIASMPAFLRVVSHLIPATYYLRVIRGIMLKGESWFPVEAGIMLLMAVILLTLATRRFKARLE